MSYVEVSRSNIIRQIELIRQPRKRRIQVVSRMRITYGLLGIGIGTLKGPAISNKMVVG